MESQKKTNKPVKFVGIVVKGGPTLLQQLRCQLGYHDCFNAGWMDGRHVVRRNGKCKHCGYAWCEPGFVPRNEIDGGPVKIEGPNFLILDK